MKTYSAKPKEVEKKWWIVDATDLVLGRTAASIAMVLRGKHKAQYTPHIDCGDHVVVVNAEKVHLTGRKMTDKKYYRHTGYPGGIKETTPAKIMEGKFPERIIQKAVQRMMPKTPMGSAQLTKLHVYAGAQHPHEGQKPEVLDIAGQNEKNKKRVA